MPIRKEPLASSEMGGRQEQPRQGSLPKWEISRPRHTLSDLILPAQTSTQLLDVISFFQNRELLFDKWGLGKHFSVQKGLAVNLYGPPGTGKTVAAHALADALNFPMICVDYAEIESKYVGETSKNLSGLFKLASEKNAVIFFDEADALLSKRVTNMTSATDVSVNQTRSVLLNLLNDYQGIIIFATNFIQNFDTAFLRRIKYHIRFYLPDVVLREKLWRMYIPDRMPCYVDFAALAKKYDGISGSDIANAVLTAAVQAARFGEESVSQQRFEEAIQSCIDVKQANEGGKIIVSKRTLSEEEARQKLGME